MLRGGGEGNHEMFAASVATSEGKLLAREVKKETNLRLSRFSCQTSSLLASSRRSDIYIVIDREDL